MNDKTSVQPGGYLDIKFAEIKTAHENYQNALKAEPAEKASKTATDRFDTKVGKKEAALQLKITEYVVAVNDFIDQGAIASDFNGVINKTHIPEVCVPMVNKALTELGEKNVTDVALMRDHIVAAAAKGKGKIMGALSNGVAYFFDSETGKVTLLYQGIKRYFYMFIDKIKEMWNTLCEKLKELYNAAKEKTVGFFASIKGLFSSKKAEDTAVEVESTVVQTVPAGAATV